MPKSNIRRLRPTEYRAVVAMLEQDSDDVDELAKNIVRRLNRLRAEEAVWVRVVKHGTGVLAYGPYNTGEEARTDDQSWGPAKNNEGQMMVLSLIPPFGQPLAELDDRERE